MQNSYRIVDSCVVHLVALILFGNLSLLLADQSLTSSMNLSLISLFGIVAKVVSYQDLPSALEATISDFLSSKQAKLHMGCIGHLSQVHAKLFTQPA